MKKTTEMLPFMRLDEDVELAPGVRLVRRVPVDADFGWTAMHGFEIRKYFGPGGIDNPQVILEVDKGDLEEIAAHCCVVDLALGRWKYLLEKHHVLAAGRGVPIPPLFKLTSRRAATLRVMLPRLRSGKRKTRQRLQLSLRRWHAGANTAVGIESVMHGVAALEGLLLQGTGDMRLRLAIRAAAVVTPKKRRDVFAQVYQTYRHRNDYAHGSSIPELSKTVQLEFMKASALVISTVLTQGLPDLETLDSRVISWMPRGK